MSPLSAQFHSSHIIFMSIITQSPSVIDFIKQHPISTTLTLSTISAAAIYYLTIANQSSKPKQKLSKPLTPTPSPQCHMTQQQEQIKKQLNQLKLTRQRLIAASKDFRLEYIEQEILPNLLTEQCLLDIFDQCTELVDQQELNHIYETNRKARRTVFPQILINAKIKQNNRRDSFQSIKSQEQRDSFPFSMTSPRNISSIKSTLHSKNPISYPEALSFSQIYYRFVCTFEEDFKYLIEKTQKDFATFLNIDFSLITESIDYHISKEDNDYFKQKIHQWTSSIRQALKNKLTKYVEPIQPGNIRQILRHQINFLKEKIAKLRQTINKLGISNEQQLDALPTLLATILQDEVYFKFNIEQEQMTVDLMHLSKNKEMQNLVQEFQQLTQKIVEEMYEQVNKEDIQDEDNEEY